MESVNQTNISLIPKVTTPDYISQFKPIGLCNVNYKILTKLLVQRIQPFMNKIVRPEQSSFVLGRQIVDNIVIIQEAVHTMRTKTGKKGFLAIKVDLEKAYDRLKWNFISETLHLVGFPLDLVNIIVDCITSVRMEVLWQGEPSEEFRPTRAIKQGDLISPYLFVLCMERLSHVIQEVVNQKEWHPLQFGKKGTKLSHIFFADDMVLFGASTATQMDVMISCLNKFCQASGAKVSVEKTKIYFSKNTTDRCCRDICRIGGFERVNNLGKYLGAPILNGRVTKATYSFILENIQKRLTGWSVEKLSLAGKLTFIQSVISALPSYIMQTALLPSSLCKDIDKLTRKFL